MNKLLPVWLSIKELWGRSAHFRGFLKRRFQLWLLVTALLGICLVLVLTPPRPQIEGPGTSRLEIGTGLIIGSVHDRQGQPVPEVEVSARTFAGGEAIAGTVTQTDGRYILALPRSIPEKLSIEIQRGHFKKVSIELDPGTIATLRAGRPVLLRPTTFLRSVGPAFWVATLVFAGVLALMAFGRLHNTLASLVGVAVIFGVSYLGRPLREDLFIFDFRSALVYIDWNVIFLIMGMMIIIAAVERTGIFQWLAYMSYRVSGGRTWLLLAILMVVAGVTSALMDNVTSMLLVAPITVQIALALGINPLALLLPEVMASNVFSISTLIGNPTNILIGSYARISFSDFLVNLTPGVLLSMTGLILYCAFIYRKELRPQEEVSPLLLEKLAERGLITEPEHLRKAGWVGAGMLTLFVLGDRVHLLPSVTALVGATALLAWIKPDMDEMIDAIDWTTLVFFIALFIVVGAIQEVGLISYVADGIGWLVKGNIVLAMLAVIWLGAILSAVIANIPFTAAMLPVIAYMTATVPGAEGKVLFYCLAVGAAMGGNGSLIGASANMVTAGIAERAGYPITYAYFLRKGFAALLITVGLSTIWLLLRFYVAA